ncbi:MAG: YihA family ribosome biogenesis GTP-binding protein [Alphaproteobacteria bacterium]|nr:YihA family ribosome biogenesis GTP-binding protein [Alphaproteobacteria bacterium]
MTAPAPAAPPRGGLAEARTEAERALLIEAGRLLFAAPAQFFHAAQSTAGLPAPGLPEVAFAGRSNVGKSSLLNALTGRKALARVSATPGRTRQLNFFDLGGRLALVDMPGYGYAQASKSLKADWQGLMFDYLRRRPTLARVCLLLDASLPPKPVDRAVMDLLDTAAVSFQLVLTKADRVRPGALAARLAEAQALARSFTAGHPLVLATSAEKGTGIAELRAELAAFAAPPDRQADALPA